MNRTSDIRATRAVAVLLGPDRAAVSGVSSHLNAMLNSPLADAFTLVHFQVGSQGREESTLGFLLRLLISPFALAAFIRRHRAEVVHLNTSLDARAFWRDLVYMLVARSCSTRVIYQVHGGALPDRFFGGGLVPTKFLKWALTLPAAIVVLARSELAAYCSFVPFQRVLCIPNAVDCRLYPRTEKPESDPGDSLQLVFLGRLVKTKGLFELLNGLAIATDRNVRAHLFMAGSGPDHAALSDAVARLGLTNVSIPGPVFGRDKIRLLDRADVFVLPSYREGMPYALLEAMAAGTPALVTPVGGIPDVIEDGIHGTFVPVGDAAAIAAAIAEFASDRSRLACMSIACRQRIASEYSADRLAEHFGRLYTGSYTACESSLSVGHNPARD